MAVRLNATRYFSILVSNRLLICMICSAARWMKKADSSGQTRRSRPVFREFMPREIYHLVLNWRWWRQRRGRWQQFRFINRLSERNGNWSKKNLQKNDYSGESP